MTEGPDPIHEAVAFLRGKGQKVDPWPDAPKIWVVNGESLNEHQVVALALRLGLMDGHGRTQ